MAIQLLSLDEELILPLFIKPHLDQKVKYKPLVLIKTGRPYEARVADLSLISATIFFQTSFKFIFAYLSWKGIALTRRCSMAVSH